MANGDDSNKYTIDQIKERLALLDTEVSLNKELLTTTERRAEESKNEITRIESLIAAEKERLAIAEKKGQLSKEELETHQEILGELEKELKAQKKIQENLKKSVDAGNALAGAFGNYFSILTMVDDTYKNTLLGSMLDAVTSTEGMQHAMEKTMKAAKAFPKMALGTLFAQIEQSTIGTFKAMLDLNAELSKATGISGKNFALDIKATADELADFGVTIEDAGASLKSLYINFSNFRNLNKESQQVLRTSVTQFAAIGVNADTATNFMDGLTKAFGMTIPQAASLTNQFIGLSSEVKFTAEELMDSFTSLNKDLAAFGKKAPEIFKNLVKQSDALGVSLENLVGVAKQFDTFDAAAEAVGKLNTLMGGNFIDMQRIMRMGYDERIQYIKDEVTARMGSFESMNEFQRRYVAMAAGFSSVEDAMKVLGDQQVENDKTLEQYGLTQEKMNQLAKDAAGPLKLMDAAIQQLAIDVAPLVKDFATFVGDVATFIKENKDEIKMFAGMALGLMAIAKVVKIFIALKKGFDFFKGLSKKTQAAGTLAQSAANYKLAGSVLVLGKAGLAAAPGLTAITAAMMKMSIPIAIITAGIVAVAFLVVDLMKHAIDAKVPLTDLGVAFLEIAAAVSMMAITGGFAAVAMIAMAVGIGAMAAALAFVKTDDLQALARIFTSLAALQKADSPFSKWNESMVEFAKNSMSIQTHLGLVAQGLRTINDIQPKGIVPMTQFVKSVSSIDEASAEGITKAKEMIVALKATTNTDSIKALEGLIKQLKSTSGASSASTRSQPQEVTLEVNGVKLGRIVGSYLDKSLERVEKVSASRIP